MKIGIIGGAGKMGSWLAKHLKEKHEIEIYDINTNSMHKTAEQLNINYTTTMNELVLKNDVIIVAVNLNNVPKVLHELLLLPIHNKIIFDIASFKKDIIPIYLKYPKTASVCTIHPLFGPGARTIKNAPIVIIPIPSRENEIFAVEQLFKEFNSKIIIIDWETHDKIMGLTLGVPYITGLAIATLVKDNEDLIKTLSGTSFKIFYTYMNSILNEDSSLISEIITNNSSINAITNYIKTLEEISKFNAKTLTNLITNLKNQLKIDPNAYKKIYDYINSI